MIYIRADANKNIGMGHVMRCLSIADAMLRYDEDIIFVLADDTVSKLINDRGFKTVVLNTDYRKMDSEIENWPKEEADLIIVDSYFVTNSFFDGLKCKGRLAYIDDLFSFQYNVDMLINYNVYADRARYEELYNDSRMPMLLLGPEYAPLRKMFSSVKAKKQNEVVKDILFSTGGSDSLHLALSIIKAKHDDLIYHFIVGPLNCDKEEIKTLASKNAGVVIHENVTDMKSLISDCDIAVSAAGSTLYEICACGTPIITFVTADNQVDGADYFEKAGLAVNAGDMRLDSDPVGRLLKNVGELADDEAKRAKMSKMAQEKVDGKGAERIAKALSLS